MARYIDADKADVEAIHTSHMGYSSKADIVEWLKKQPTADVVEVVRCKNCTHGVDYCGRTMCGKNARRINDGIVGLTATSPEHFCSYGERSNT